jgi:Ulp1 family protease
MKQYEKAHDDFVFLGPIPSDCPTKIHCELSKLDLMNMKKKNIHKIGIIYNLDVSSGPGTHWVGMYIDNKNNEINYYDSYGSLPTSLINKFIKRIVDQYNKNNINPVVIYNDKRYQYGGSECGLFSMNFILERLYGSTMYDIINMDIPDSKMTHLRKLLYNTKV